MLYTSMAGCVTLSLLVNLAEPHSPVDPYGEAPSNRCPRLTPKVLGSASHTLALFSEDDPGIDDVLGTL